MVFIISCIVIWSIVLLVIPFKRIKDLSAAVLIAFTWMVFVDNISASLGYYSYNNTLLSIGKAPIFQNLAEGGAGILMLNWLKENSFTKLLSIVIAGIAFVSLHSIYLLTGALTFGIFDNTLNFIHHIAALSIFLLLSLAIIGEEKVYSGNKSRFSKRSFA